MNDYGLAALLARKYCVNGKHPEPAEAWFAATAEIFPNRKSSQKKSCPKGAFLGLCGRGWIVGVERKECPPTKNGSYAVLAVEVLRRDGKLTSAGSESLWKALGIGIRHNHQMDVVLALWNAGWIER